MPSTRLKVACQSKWPGKHDGQEIFYIGLNAVYSGSEENKAFFAATPSASITFGTVNKEAAEQFQPGKEYYLDITPTEESI